MIEYVNAALLRSGSYDIEDLIGRPLATLYTRDVFARVLDQLRETAEGRASMQHEIQALDNSGRGIWLQINTVPIFDNAGRLTYFVRIGRDVTVRKRIEQERETTQRLLASVFGVIDQALAVVDDCGNFSMVNTAVTRQLGWSVFDLIGRPFTSVIDESSRKWLTRQLAAREEEEQTTRLPTELLHRNGTVIGGEIVSTVIMQPDGRQYRVITFRQKAAVGHNCAGRIDPIGGARAAAGQAAARRRSSPARSSWSG
ncbi:MAG: PAS domain S-box protein [Aliidongia sp.]